MDAGPRIVDVPVPTRYFPEASSASFVDSTIYGCCILWLLAKYQLHCWGAIRQRRFETLRKRYVKLQPMDEVECAEPASKP